MPTHLEDGTEPLIVPERDENENPYTEQVDDTAKPGYYVWFLTIAAALSGLLFGYDTGVMSATLVSLNSDLGHPLSVWEKSLLTSITSLTALVASPVSGSLADKLGRKPIILLCDSLFIFGALLQAFASSVNLMTIGRAIVGLAIGAASAISPLYIAELSPASWRGRLVTVSTLFITGGQVVAYVVGWAFTDVVSGWRWMVGIGALPAAIQAIALLNMPESPRWLLKVGSADTARKVLRLVYQDSLAMADDTFKHIVEEIKEEDEDSGSRNDASTWRIKNTASELWRIKSNRKALKIACTLQAAQQLSGFNTLMFFSATIFAMSGFTKPVFTALVIALTNFALTLVAFGAIDYIGRRRILLMSMPIMSIGLLLSALAFAHIDISPAVLDAINQNSNPSWSGVLLFSFILFIAAYAIGIGNVPWQQAELFPLRVRALGSALATSTNWGSNFIVSISFLPMMQILSPPITMILYAAICAASWFAVYVIYPETKGLNLEDITKVLAQ